MALTSTAGGCRAKDAVWPVRRRTFLRLGAVAASMPSMLAFCRCADEPNLRLGILSDIHLRDALAAKKLERALLAYRGGRVDGVLVCGDLADNGIVPQLEELARIWEEVFPGSKGLDGAHVERLFHYGDHDNRGIVNVPEDVVKRYGWTVAERNTNAITLRPKEVWERIFGEPWSPIVHKRVKGYDFVLSHYTPQGRNSPLGLEGFLREFKPDPDKPFFYSQHRVLRNTVCGPGVWGQDNGTAGRLLASYPNCCAFCGHSHQTAVREDAVWQGAFTAVQVPSLRYVTQEPGHGANEKGYLAEQGMLLDAYDDRLVVRRLDFTTGRSLGLDWEIPLVGGARPFAHEIRRRVMPVPEFRENARLVASINSLDGTGRDKSLVLDFPVVSGNAGGARAYDYEVVVDAICFGGDARRAVRHFFSPKCHFAPSAEPETMQLRIPLREFAEWYSSTGDKWNALHVAVRPREVFGRAGRALEADIQYVCNSTGRSKKGNKTWCAK